MGKRKDGFILRTARNGNTDICIFRESYSGLNWIR